jgi:hypothetical protein
MSIKGLFQTSDKLESEGIWIDYGTEQVRILRAGARNTKYKEMFARLTKPHAKLIKRDALPEETSERIMYQCYAECIIVDWKVKVGDEWLEGKMFGDNDEPVDFTVDRAIGMFKKYPDFFADLRQQSEDAVLFRADEVEEQGK